MRAEPPRSRAKRRLAAVGVALALATVVPARGAQSPESQSAPAPPTAGSFRRAMFRDRAYALYAPADVQPVGAAPAPAATALPLRLVVALHGCWQTPEDFAQGSRLNIAAEQRHFLVVYPIQSRTANLSRCWNWFEAATASTSETRQIVALVRYIADTYGVARDRIIAVGLSAGGFMAVNLACVAPDLIAAVGVVAGGPYHCGVGVEGGLQCMRGHAVNGETSATACLAVTGSRTRTVRASLWQGADDTVVNPTNLEALAVMFARVNGLSVRSGERREGATVAVYRDAAGRPVVEAWLVPDVDHAWSGGDPRATHTAPQGPDTTRRMLDFLLGPM